MPEHENLTLKEREIIETVESHDGFIHTKEVTARTRFCYKAVRETLKSLEEGGYIAKSDDRGYVQGYLWQITQRGAMYLHDN